MTRRRLALLALVPLAAAALWLARAEKPADPASAAAARFLVRHGGWTPADPGPPPDTVLSAPLPGALPPVDLGDMRLVGGRIAWTAKAGGPLRGEAWLEPKGPVGAREVDVELWSLRDKEPSVRVRRTVGEAWPTSRWEKGTVVVDRFEIALPPKTRPGTYAVRWRPVTTGKSGDGVVIGHVQVGKGGRDAALAAPDPALDHPPFPAAAPDLQEGPVVALGGDASLGRRQNAMTPASGPERVFARLPQLRKADLAFVNLESVVAAGGEPFDKGEPAPYYYRGRPEGLDVLVRADVGVVQGANNHAGDYGPDAMAEEVALLDAAGIAHPGIGRTWDEACAPVYRRAGDLVVAWLALSDQSERAVATADRAGICFLKADPTAWREHLEPRIVEARQRADLVFVGVHWGPNGADHPSEGLEALSHAIVDAGADAVIGTSAHVLQGLEIYQGKPILHDIGNILFDTYNPLDVTGLFELVLGPTGVRQVRMHPVELGAGESHVAKGALAHHALARFRDLSATFGVEVGVRDGVAVVDLPEPSARAAPPERPPADPPLVSPPTPGTPPAQCVTDAVPEDARLPPTDVGPFRLVGARVSPAVQEPHRMVWAETWWTVTEPLDAGAEISVVFQAPDLGGKTWRSDHQGCDWAWPTDRWTPGTIWVDRHGVRPASGDEGLYEAKVGLVRGKVVVGEYVPIGAISVAKP